MKRMLFLVSILILSANISFGFSRYEYPGYSKLGVYIGAPNEYFDYSVSRIVLGDTMENKKEWWDGLKKKPMGRNDILIVHCGERENLSLEVLTKRLDTWLESDKNVKTDPSLISAVCIGEENIPNNSLNVIAKHLKEKYNLFVFQWLSYPLFPSTDIIADGWIYDAYTASKMDFRQFVLAYTSMKKPFVYCFWATDPHWDSNYYYKDVKTMIQSEWHQLDTCKEFNIAPFGFCVSDVNGSVNAWQYLDDNNLIILRDAVFSLKKDINSFSNKKLLPLPSANYSYKERVIACDSGVDNEYLYEEDFKDFKWVKDCDITGFLNLKVASAPEKTGSIVNLEGGNSSLTYAFKGFYPIKDVAVEIDSVCKGLAKTKVEYSFNKIDWKPILTLDKTSKKISKNKIALEPSLSKLVYVRLSMEGGAKATGEYANIINSIKFFINTDIKEARCMLSPDYHGIVNYVDNFNSYLWQSFGSFNPSLCGRWSFDRGFTAKIVSGYADTAILTQKFSLQTVPKELKIKVDGSGKSELGGILEIGIAPAGGEVIEKQDVASSKELIIKKENLANLKDFDLYVYLKSNAGTGGGQIATSLKEIKIYAR